MRWCALMKDERVLILWLSGPKPVEGIRNTIVWAETHSLRLVDSLMAHNVRVCRHPVTETAAHDSLRLSRPNRRFSHHLFCISSVAVSCRYNFGLILLDFNSNSTG